MTVTSVLAEIAQVGVVAVVCWAMAAVLAFVWVYLSNRDH